VAQSFFASDIFGNGLSGLPFVFDTLGDAIFPLERGRGRLRAVVIELVRGIAKTREGVESAAVSWEDDRRLFDPSSF
jgi:hypothetical protein